MTKIAFVLGLIHFLSFSKSKLKFFILTSQNTGLNPLNKTEAMSEIQVRGGTIISHFFPSSFLSSIYLRANIVSSLAAEPELTIKLCFTPSQLDHSSSNFLTLDPFVSLGIGSCWRKSTTSFASARVMLSSISGMLKLLFFIIVVAPLY